MSGPDPVHAPLPPAVQRLLSSYRDGRRMPSDAFSRVERRLDRKGPRRLSVVIVALAAAAAVVVGLVAADALQTTAVSAAHQQASDVLPPIEEGGRASDRAHATLPPAELVPGAAHAAGSQVIAPHGPVAKPSPARSGASIDPASDASSGSTLADERRLLAQANTALADRDLTGALAAVDRYDRAFPRGALAPEMAAVRTMARCHRQPANATAELAQFERTHGASVLLSAVRRACGVTDPAGNDGPD